ncbi:hypothetical protein N7454_000424 [Penicillium verhagenii]|nr:hypothetical protein N7454_000424 [Penicillium verhagenii]
MSLSDSDGDIVVVSPGEVRDFNSDNILPLPAKDLAEITKWLQPTPYDFERSEYSRHRASHLLGTGAWLTSTPVYQQWHSGDNGLLWIKGKPGSGKSVMAASIIKSLQNLHVPVIFFFFRQIIDANHKPIVALRDWLCQILDYSPPLQVKLNRDVNGGRSLDSLSLMDLWDDLKMALSGLNNAYCVTDALDEMDFGNDDFLNVLVELGHWRPKNIKVLMTSRPVARLETSLRSSMISIPQIRLEEMMVDRDIQAYVQYRLRGSSIAKEQWSVIEEAIPGRANGMFLYAKISMDAFLEPDADVREVLNALPMDLNTMYNELLQEHSRRSNVPFELQLLILQFVTHATRPLRLLEIAEMINKRDSDGSQTLKETKDLVRSACGPLLEILPDETVSVIHHSFTEFLKGDTRSKSSDSSWYPILEAGPTNSNLAVACLYYMQEGRFDNVEVTKKIPKQSLTVLDHENPQQKRERELRLQFPFLEYAAKNWDKHALRAETSGEDMEKFYNDLDKFLAETTHAWINLAWPGLQTHDVTPLKIVAETGLAQFAKHLLSSNDCKDMKPDELPIFRAASNGFADVVQIFIEHGADINAEGSEGLTPLHGAAKLNRVDVVKVLLAAGADPMTPKTKEDIRRGGMGCRIGSSGPSTQGQTPLMYACHSGHLQTVAEFVPLLKLEDLLKALHWAAEKGRSNIVELILKQPGIDVDAKLENKTALFLACNSKDFKSIELLVKAGASPLRLCGNAGPENSHVTRSHPLEPPARGENLDCKPERGLTALHSLCNNANRMQKSCEHPMQCVRLLLEAGVDINSRASDGSTALHYAMEGAVELIKPLLEAGADPTAEDDKGVTPLHSTRSFKDEAIALLLSSGKVNINKPRKKDGKPPLLCYIENNVHYNSIIFFLKYKPDMNATDSQGNGPLHVALRRGPHYSELIDALLSAGADPNLKNYAGNTSLHVMKHDITENILKSLVLAGADLEAQNHKGQSVLSAQVPSSKRGFGADSSSILSRLVGLGAQLDTRSYSGQTLWHRAIGNPDALSCLQSMGLDPSVSDYHGNTPLHAVITDSSIYNKPNVLGQLMEMGMNINQRNHQGRTVLHTVCLRDDSSKETYELLDNVIGICESSSPSDHKGIQPLHIAATVSEAFSYKLLNAGADIRASTREKMTALHLAARARQSGIVDMILSRAQSLDEKSRLEFVNSQDADGRIALHYACRSGRPETVKSLIEAGADVKILDIHKHSALAMCAEYEKEASRWELRMPFLERGQQTRDKGLNAAGLTLKDETRPFPDRADNDIEPKFGEINSEHDTTRLDEIVDLLLRNGLDPENDVESLRFAWKTAAKPEYGYTLSHLPPQPKRDLLTSTWNHWGDYSYLEKFDQDRRISIAINHRKAMRETLEKNEPRAEDDEENKQIERHAASLQERPLRNALALRHYDLFEKIAEGMTLDVFDKKTSITLNRLALWGFAEILSRVCTREMAIQLDLDHLDPDSEEMKRLQNNKPLVISACERQLPNMDTLKLVVEKFGININAKCFELALKRRLGFKFTRGALHDLAAGKQWWHVDKALPYLFKMGADINIRNLEEETPLLVALKSGHPFSKQAATALIEAGADVNAVDTNGVSCLSSAGDDLGMIKLLISHGAEVSPKAVLSALDVGQIEILEALLSHGGHETSTQLLPRVLRYNTDSGGFKVLGDETLPLLGAAMHSAQRGDRGIKLSTRKRMVEVLLKYGANPYATFSKQEYKLTRGPSLTKPDDIDFPVMTTTVIHELLRGDKILEPFFGLPSLNLEHRDESGCTLLLAASMNLGKDYGSNPKTNSINCFQELVNRGANVLAQDIEGKTILHHIRTEIHADIDISMLQNILEANPSLVNMTDNANETALHYALRADSHFLINFLLDNGANPCLPDKEGQSALHHLAKCRSDWNEELFQRFLQAGLDINARNNEGETPFFELVRHGNEGLWLAEKGPIYKGKAFEFFLKCGADLFAKSDNGSNLLHVLAGIKLDLRHSFLTFHPGAGRVGVLKFKRLMDLGLDPMAEDGRQRTSIDIAAASENELILKLFKREQME